MTDGVIAALITGAIGLMGSAATAMLTSTLTTVKVATKVEEGFEAMKQRLDAIDSGQSEQWKSISSTKKDVQDHEGRIGYLEGKANGKVRAMGAHGD